MKPRGDAKPICSIRFLGRLESKVSTQALSSQHHTPPLFVPTFVSSTTTLKFSDSLPNCGIDRTHLSVEAWSECDTAMKSMSW